MMEIDITMNCSVTLTDNEWQSVKREAAEYGIDPTKLLEEKSTLWFDEFQANARVTIDLLDEDDVA